MSTWNTHNKKIAFFFKHTHTKNKNLVTQRPRQSLFANAAKVFFLVDFIVEVHVFNLCDTRREPLVNIHILLVVIPYEIVSIKKTQGAKQKRVFFCVYRTSSFAQNSKQSVSCLLGFFYISGKRKTVDPQLHDPKTRFCVPFSLVVKPRQFARAFFKKKET